MYAYINTYLDIYTFSHLKRPFYWTKKRKNVKSIVGISPTMV